MAFRHFRTLVGSPSDERRRTALLAVALFVASAAVFATVPRFEPPFASSVHRLLHSANRALWWEYYAVGLVAGIALLTARRRSPRRSWLFAFAGGAGVGVNLGGIGLTGNPPDFVFRLLWAGGLGTAAALVLGTVGFALGAGLRRIGRSHE